MKKTKKLLSFIVAVALVLSSVLALVACQKEKYDCEKNGHKFENGKCTECGIEPAATADYIDLADYKAYLKNDLGSLVKAVGAISSEVDAEIAEAKTAGEKAIDAAETISAAKTAHQSAARSVQACITLASGIINYSGLSTAEKTKILGIIEEFCIRNGMLGLTLYENGVYQMFNSRVQLGAENYIIGYGFGTLREGNITADLESEQNTAWKRYYHTVMSEDPGTISYLNSQKSTVGDLYGYMGASYFGNAMNEDKDGYLWITELAKEDPVAVGGLDANGQAQTWRFEINTSELKYNTNSQIASRKAFDGRKVAAEDYLTPFKFLLNAANKQYRGGELAEQTGAQAIVGAANYYAASQKVNKEGILSNEDCDFSKVGIKIVEEGGKTYFQYTLGAPVTPFYARYYISSSLYAPIPEDFINLVGASAYGGFSESKTETPVDNILSLGAYTLERWDSGQQIVFKKNPYYISGENYYKIPGIHINILTAAKTDREASIKEFLAGKTDACTIPSTYLKEYKNDPRTKVALGDSCFKLNMNALDQATWEKLFGENGTYAQTSKENYWKVEPALGNSHFRLALSYALNRNEFADAKGNISSVNYFSSDYMSDPENGISYNSTPEHEKAVEQLTKGTTGGYNLELAREYFKVALDELEADGLILPGTKAKPTVIELEIAWQTASDEEDIHKYVKQYWEDAFNDESVSGGRYKLECKFWVGKEWSDVYYEKMLKGQYDIGFGSISGNPLDPLSFFNINSTDVSISHEFTLNWAIDTSAVNNILVYNGMLWSFDALYQATQEKSFIDQGVLESSTSFTKVEATKGTDEALTVTIDFKYHKLVDGVEITNLVLFGQDSNSYNEFSVIDYLSGEIAFNEAAHTYTIKLVIPKSEYSKLPIGSNQGLDVYFNITIEGEKSESSATAKFNF